MAPASFPRTSSSPSFTFLRVDDVAFLVKNGEVKAAIVKTRRGDTMVTIAELMSGTTRISKSARERILRALRKLEKMIRERRVVRIAEGVEVVLTLLPPRAAIMVAGKEVLAVTSEGYERGGRLARSAEEKARMLAEARREAEELGAKPATFMKAVVTAARMLREHTR